MTGIRLTILLSLLLLTVSLVAGCKDDPITITPPTAAADALPAFSDLGIAANYDSLRTLLLKAAE